MSGGRLKDRRWGSSRSRHFQQRKENKPIGGLMDIRGIGPQQFVKTVGDLRGEGVENRRFDQKKNSKRIENLSKGRTSPVVDRDSSYLGD